MLGVVSLWTKLNRFKLTLTKKDRTQHTYTADVHDSETSWRAPRGCSVHDEVERADVVRLTVHR